MRATCIDCLQPMRPVGVKASERPGTIQHGGFGYCTNCRRRHRLYDDAVQKVAEALPPRELSADETKVLAMLRARGLDGELRRMFGFDDVHQHQPLTDVGLMRNGLTMAQTVVVSDNDRDLIRSTIERGSVKGRKL